MNGKELFDKLSIADAVIWDDRFVVFPIIENWRNSDDNEVLTLSVNSDGLSFSATFNEESFDTAVICNDGIEINDVDGELSFIELLYKKPLDI